MAKSEVGAEEAAEAAAEAAVKRNGSGQSDSTTI